MRVVKSETFHPTPEFDEDAIEERSDGGADSGSVKSFLTGIRNPLPVAATDGALLVGDWSSGTIYRVEL